MYSTYVQSRGFRDTAAPHVHLAGDVVPESLACPATAGNARPIAALKATENAGQGPVCQPCCLRLRHRDSVGFSQHVIHSDGLSCLLWRCSDLCVCVGVSERVCVCVSVCLRARVSVWE